MNTHVMTRCLHPELIRELKDWFEASHQQDPLSFQVEDVEERRFSRICRVKFSESGDAESFVLKQNIEHEENHIYQNGEFAATIEFEALQAVAFHLEPGDCLRVPRALCIIPQHNAFLMSQESGESLETLIPAARVLASEEHMQVAIDAFRSAGRWLREFQKLKIHDSNDSASLGSTLEHCEDRLRQIENVACRSIPTELRSLCLRKLDSWNAQVNGPVPRGACHGDFGPWNQLYDGTRLTVLDFFSYRTDCRLTDPMSMLTYLECQRYAPSFNASKVERLQQAFLEGYDFDFDVAPQVLLICEAEQRLRRLHDCVRYRGHHWKNRFRFSRMIRKQVDWLLGESPVRELRISR